MKVPLTHVLADVLGIRKRKQLKDTQGLLAFYHMKFGDDMLLTTAGISLVLGGVLPVINISLPLLRAANSCLTWPLL